MRRIISRYAVELLCISLIATGIMVITNTGCKKRSDETPGITVVHNLQLVADGMVSPLGLAECPDGTGRLYIIDQVGKIWLVKDGKKLDAPFLDISSKMVALNPQYDERGLLGVAFHPHFMTNGRFFVFYTAPPRAGSPAPGESWNNLTRIAEYYAAPGANVADAGSEKVILEEDHPQMNHDGGTIAFGPDGYLYISIGDGGNMNDIGVGHVEDWYPVNKGGNAQNIYANLMGKVLRIDVDGAQPYSIPADNPFVNMAGAKKEIYAFGFRNPYRFSFDREGSHQLFLGDAGQILWEEINIVEKGGNYGWNVKEGSICFNADDNKQTRSSCPSTDTMNKWLIDPIIEVKNANNSSGGGIATTIIGGYVYRGTGMAEIMGRYVFGTFSTSSNPDAKLYITGQTSAGHWNYQKLYLKDFPENLGMYLKGFGEDAKGELYVATSSQAGVSGNTGKVYKLIESAK